MSKDQPESTPLELQAVGTLTSVYTATAVMSTLAETLTVEDSDFDGFELISFFDNVRFRRDVEENLDIVQDWITDVRTKLNASV